jgi:hypothetical protein
MLPVAQQISDERLGCGFVIVLLGSFSVKDSSESIGLASVSCFIGLGAFWRGNGECVGGSGMNAYFFLLLFLLLVVRRR